MYSFGDISKLFKSGIGRTAAGQQAVHTQVCPLFTKELRSELCAPLVIIALLITVICSIAQWVRCGSWHAKISI